VRLRSIDNGNGRVTAMTLITPLRPRWLAWQWLVFLYWRYKPHAGQKLKNQNSVHFGWWGIIPRVPYNGPPQPPETLPHKMLMFDSNFDGPWPPYIAMFGQVLSVGVTAIWKASIGYPGSRPTTLATHYVDANQFPVDHYYAAYPEATCSAVMAALRLQEQVDAFEDQTADLDDRQWYEAYQRFVREAQRRL